LSLLKPLGRMSNAWHELIKGNRDAFEDQRNLLSEIEVNTIFDIGANIGDTVKSYNSLFNKASIYAFEPSPDLFQKLETRFRRNNRVKPIKAAVAEVCCVRNFYITRHSAAHSLLVPEDDAEKWMYPHADKDATEILGQIDVPVVTVDDFCKQESINDIQILKIDIQGGELMALEGAKGKLRQGSILLIYTEMLFVPLYQGQAFYHNICNFLSEYGYSLFDVYNRTYAKNRQLKWCDAIFISPKLYL
jgi:FkbM family methyltransferase